MKRGNLFMMEFILGAIILLSFFVYLLPYLKTPVDNGALAENYAVQSLNLLKNTPVRNFNEESLLAIWPNMTCLDCMMIEQIGMLLYHGHVIQAENLSNTTLVYLIPETFGYGITMISPTRILETFVHNVTPQNKDKGHEIMMVDSALVSGVSEDGRRIHVMQLRVWQ